MHTPCLLLRDGGNFVSNDKAISQEAPPNM